MANVPFHRTFRTSAFYLILASRSPRRKSLLTEAGYSFAAIPAEDAAEESPRFCSDPASLVIRNARKKAEDIAGKLSADPARLAAITENHPGKRIFIVGCDTVAFLPAAGDVTNVDPQKTVSVTDTAAVSPPVHPVEKKAAEPKPTESEILGKPDNLADARRMLRLLSGSDHAVVSGMVLIDPISGRETTASETTTLYMEPLSDAALEDYLASDAWRGKAGAFGYQDGIDWLHKKSGSESNIVGLPMELLRRLLESAES